MSEAGLHVLDPALHEANLWLKDIMECLHTNDERLALAGLRAGIHMLRDHLPVDNAVHLGAQLPTMVRGLYYEGWHFGSGPLMERHKVEFLASAAKHLPQPAARDPERIVRAAFDVISQHIDPDEANKIAGVLPHEMKPLWPVSRA